MYWIDIQFAKLFAGFIQWFFYNLGLDWWHKNAKIAAFISLILVPAGMFVREVIRG